MQKETTVKTSIQIWDDLHRSVQWGTCPEPAVARWAMRRWGGRDKDAKGNIHLLEVGCGVGAMAFWLANNGFLVDAIDASEHAIERANHLYGNVWPHSLHFIAGSIESVPMFEHPPYDGVVDVCCLQHVDDLDAALREIRTLLRDGGELLSIIACADHDPVMRPELDGTTFRRLTQVELHRHFMQFSAVKLESMTHTDNGKNISHWIVQATK